jgi:hypothetical protein
MEGRERSRDETGDRRRYGHAGKGRVVSITQTLDTPLTIQRTPDRGEDEAPSPREGLCSAQTWTYIQVGA